MNQLSQIYYNLNDYLFPIINTDFGKLTKKMKEFLQILEVVKPTRFLENIDPNKGFGLPQADREKILRAFILKAVYNFPTTKLLIETLQTNATLRVLCGWDFSDEVPSEATFSRGFSTFSKESIADVIHATIIKENYFDKLVGHSCIDSTAIQGREKAHIQQWEKIVINLPKNRKNVGEKARLKKNYVNQKKLDCNNK
jgi:hypothetical protein